MFNSFIITIETEIGVREIFMSPFLLQSKQEPNIKTGEHDIKVLYFYDNLRDQDYLAMLGQKEFFIEEWKSDRYIINWGQDFEKYYLGSLHINYQTQRYWQWEGKSGSFTDKDVKALVDSVLNPQSKIRPVTLVAPTLPSDFNLSLRD
ncbi:hypothetical protein [Pedobacter heparinus]|uniref:hypothetical protein n=1 Tax=Pedobacter heparinus TaxID=984 RepID=UPI00292CF4AC|nr:hypothetical protein [Pedobacter heparinus]